MRNIRLFIISCITLAMLTQAQAQVAHVLQGGVKGSIGHYLGNPNFTNHMGVGGALDIGYIARWEVVPELQMGIHTGVSFGINKYDQHTTFVEEYPNEDYLHNVIHYVNTGKVNATNTFVNLLLPVHYHIDYKGYNANIGLQAMIPMMMLQKQTLSDWNIQATYEAYDVVLNNVLITGRFDEENVAAKIKAQAPQFSLLFSAQLAKEWPLTPLEEHYIGVGLFFNIGVYATAIAPYNGRIISITPGTNEENPVPQVSFDGYINNANANLRYLDFGIKLYYAFDLSKGF